MSITFGLIEAVLQGKEVCMSSLPEPTGDPIVGKPLPPIFHVQLDNYQQMSICVLFLVVVRHKKNLQRGVRVFLDGGAHAHCVIWSLEHEVARRDSSTLPILMKLYIDLDNVPVIPHIIEEIPNFKAFIKPYMFKGGDHLVGHTKRQQFHFYTRDDGVPAMQFKLLCTTPN